MSTPGFLEMWVMRVDWFKKNGLLNWTELKMGVKINSLRPKYHPLYSFIFTSIVRGQNPGEEHEWTSQGRREPYQWQNTEHYLNDLEEWKPCDGWQFREHPPRPLGRRFPRARFRRHFAEKLDGDSHSLGARKFCRSRKNAAFSAIRFSKILTFFFSLKGNKRPVLQRALDRQVPSTFFQTNQKK